MELRADMLRRRMALYRDCLSKGVESELARRYLCAITAAEAELAKLEGKEWAARRSV
jgi:hypothetical protein